MPNRLWVADFTYMATWTGTVAIGVFSPRDRWLASEHVEGTDLVYQIRGRFSKPAIRPNGTPIKSATSSVSLLSCGVCGWEAVVWQVPFPCRTRTLLWLRR